MKIYLHLGLPKTGTTTLQTRIFPSLYGVAYGGRTLNSEYDQSLWKHLRYAYDSFLSGYDYKDPIDKFLEQALELEESKILISDEGLMRWRSPRHPHASDWVSQNNPKVDVPRSGSHPIKHFLKSVVERLPQGSELGAILTLRNQGDYLGSLHAETFITDRTVTHLSLEQRDASLDFYGLAKDLEATLGANFLILFYEDGLNHISESFEAFIGATSKAEKVDLESRLNVRRVGEGVWKTKPRELRLVTVLRNRLNHSTSGRLLLSWLRKIAPWGHVITPKSSRTLIINETLRQEVKSHFRKDNDRLSELVGRNLKELGY